MRALRLAVLASAASIALAAGCAVSPHDNTYAFKAGTGTVASVQRARVRIPGGTAPSTPLKQIAEPRWIDGYQLALRMDDGTTQALTQDSDAFHAGDRVEVTPNGRVLKLAANGTTSGTASAPSAPVSVLVPGTGTVQSVSESASSAAAGGTAPSRRVEVRMDNGTTQWVDAQGVTLQPGQRVTVTSDGRVTQ